MQAKAIAAQARRMDKDINDCMKKITFELKRDNVEGARIFANMATQYKAQKNKYLLMSCKLDAAAGQLRLSLGSQEAMKAIAKATYCLNGLQNPDPVESFRVFGEFNKAMDDQFVTQEVMNRAMGPTVADSESADSLLQQAQLEIASQNPLFLAPASQPEVVSNGAVDLLAKRLEALMPSILVVC